MKRVRPPVLLVLVVLGLHLLAGHEVLRIHEGWVSDASPPAPARMRVEFVQEMAPQAPSPARTQRPAQSGAEPLASQAVAQVAPRASSVPDAASAPASAPEVAPAVAEAASAPSGLPSTGVVADAAAPDDEPGAEWPLSTRLSYHLNGNYRGPVSGQAQVEWLRKGADYQVHLDVGIGPSFAPLVTRRMSSQGRLTPSGIVPQRYDEQTKVIFGEPRGFNLVFLGGVPLVDVVSGAIQSAPQDAASQFVQLTWLFLTGREPLGVGRIVRFPLRLPSGPYEWQYEVVGEEQLDTPMGPLSAWHLKPRQAARGTDLTAEVWLAPSLQFLPVRLLIRQDADTYLDLTLKGAPLQAAPESSDAPSRRPGS